jgi:bzd-type benzoyl-CoA reductase Q subunit
MKVAEDKKEFWRWPESRWIDQEMDWRKGKTITCGIDVGSVSTQGVIMVDGELYCYGSMRTGASSPNSSIKVFNMAVEGTGIKVNDLHFTVGTGYGRINVPFGNRAITEIACHAKGANWMYGPSVRTVLDMGGQDCKAIKVDEKGKVRAFLMNDKCAAGSGRSMEVFAELIGVPIQEIGDMSFRIAEEPQPVNSTCVIFAKSEALNLLRSGWPKEKVLAAYCSAIAHRVFSLLEKVNVERDFAITGGIVKNQGVVKRITKELGIEACETKWHNKAYADRGVPFDTQLAGAIGAALFGKALYEKGRK